jgi:beta-glucosidase
MQVESSQFAPTNEAEVGTLLQQMTLAEKIGQMTQVEKNSIQPDDTASYFIGSILSGGGGNPASNSPEEWSHMVRGFQEAALKTRLRIPLIYGVDAVHGHNNMRGAVIFPHNVGLGAANDADLVQRIGRVTARELMATNVHWNFAPAVSVPQDVRWGRSYEGFSENTDLVIKMSSAYIRGLQDEQPRVMASVKHFVGDGGTQWGSTSKYPWMHGNWQAPGDGYSIDQGNNTDEESLLRNLHLEPYRAAIEAGAVNIMVSFSSWQGLKMHAHKYLITDVLKGEMGFNGFVVSDWMAINQIEADYYNCVVRSINAGLDMIMVPFDYKGFIATLTQAVEKGDVSMARIDDAVARILRAKLWLGMFDYPFGRDDLLPEVGSAAHREVAREAVRKSLVLLKNENAALPLPRDTMLLVAGSGVENIGMMCGGWSIDWQGGQGAITTGTSVLEGIREQMDDNFRYNKDGAFAVEQKAPYGLVVVGEVPYAEGLGDNGTLTLSEEDIATIARVRQQVEKLVVVLISGRPLVITEQLELADAFVAAWLPGTEGNGVTDVLFGDAPFVGRLSFSWLRSADQAPLNVRQQSPDGALFPLGYGLSY